MQPSSPPASRRPPRRPPRARPKVRSSAKAAGPAPSTSGTQAPAPTQTQTPTRLADLAQAAQTAIRITSQAGGTSARITLQPQELGNVEIHLSYGAGGVTATIHADNPQAVQMLQQAAPDLRRALEGQGLSLLGFDVRDRSNPSANGDPPPRRGGSGAEGDEASAADEVAGVALDPGHLPEPGRQVDVLA